MPWSAALPFYLRRSHDVVGSVEITSTTERIHGLLKLEDERLVVQWRLARETERYGTEIRTDHELEPVREIVLPLAALAGAEVRADGWRRLLGPQVVLTAADLRAFESIAGAAGLRMSHPATLVLRVKRSECLAAREFAAELNLALAETALQRAEAPDALPAPTPERAIGASAPE